jgi:putative flippase GtrA
LPRIQANLISTTAGMLLDFILHYALVFHPAQAALPSRIAKYVVTIGFSVYVVQSAVIYILAKLWRGPVQLVQAIHGQTHLMPQWSNDFLDRVTGKFAAALAGMAWNFIMFKLFVYAG